MGSWTPRTLIALRMHGNEIARARANTALAGDWLNPAHKHGDRQFVQGQIQDFKRGDPAEIFFKRRGHCTRGNLYLLQKGGPPKHFRVYNTQGIRIWLLPTRPFPEKGCGPRDYPEGMAFYM